MKTIIKKTIIIGGSIGEAYIFYYLCAKNLETLLLLPLMLFWLAYGIGEYLELTKESKDKFNIKRRIEIRADWLTWANAACKDKDDFIVPSQMRPLSQEDYNKIDTAKRINLHVSMENGWEVYICNNEIEEINICNNKIIT